MLEDDSEVTMVCAGNSGGSVTGYRTTSNEVLSKLSSSNNALH